MPRKPVTGLLAALLASEPRAASTSPILWMAILALSWAGCGSERETPPDSPPSPVAISSTPPRAAAGTAAGTAANGVADDSAQQLSVLGYVDYAPTRDAGADGVTIHDRERTSPGYNLYVNRTKCSARLMDAEGTTLHEWAASGCRRWERARLLPDGDLLVVGSAAGNADPASDPLATRSLARIAWNGDLVWRSSFPAHHDVAPLDDGFLSLNMSLREVPELSRDSPIMDNSLIRLTGDGVMIESLSLLDAFRGRRARSAS